MSTVYVIFSYFQEWFLESEGYLVFLCYFAATWFYFYYHTQQVQYLVYWTPVWCLHRGTKIRRDSLLRHCSTAPPMRTNFTGTFWSERWQCECCKRDKSATERASNTVALLQAPITLSTTAVLVWTGLTEGRPWRAVGHFSVEVSGSVAPLEPQWSQLQALRTGCFPKLQPLWLGGQV